MTVLKIDDELARLGSAAAAVRGKSFDDFVIDLLRQAIAASGSVQPTQRNGIAVMQVPPGTPPIDPGVIRRHVEEEGF
jgi:hypothetical protein